MGGEVFQNLTFKGAMIFGEGDVEMKAFTRVSWYYKIRLTGTLQLTLHFGKASLVLNYILALFRRKHVDNCDSFGEVEKNEMTNNLAIAFII